MNKPVETTDPQRRRRKQRIQQWMRNQTVFRSVVFLGITAFRLWRLWDEAVKRFGG